MKKLALLFLLLTGCSHTMLSTDGKVYQKTVKGVPLLCTIVNEWDVKSLRPDGKEKGCWCRYPPSIIPGVGALVTFQLSKDEFCQEGEVVLPPVRRSNFEGDQRL